MADENSTATPKSTIGNVSPSRSPPPVDLILDVQEPPNNQHNDRDVNDDDRDESEEVFFKKMRGWLMIVAILAAGATYQAGLSPPGGLWQDTENPKDNSIGHLAGNPIMHDENFKRYQTFFYCNAISFLASLVVIVLLMERQFFHEHKKIKVLKITLVIDLFAFMTAYASGSTRRFSSSAYVFLVMGGVFAYVSLMLLMAAYADREAIARHYANLQAFVSGMLCTRKRMRSHESDDVVTARDIP